MDIINLFSTPLYITNINITEEEMQFIMSDTNYTLNNFGNYVSQNKQMLNNEIFNNINEQINYHIQKYVNDVLGYDAKLKVITSWVTRNPPKTSHHTHIHKNSILSGVMYLTDNPSSICFYKENTYPIQPEKIKNTQYNSDSYAVKCEKNMLILFPSDLHHGVEINTNEYDRFSLAFNAFYTGIIGDDSILTKLELL